MVCPAENSWVATDASTPAGVTRTYPAAVGEPTSTLTTTAVAAAGTPARPAIGTTFGAVPTLPDHTRVVSTGTYRPVDGAAACAGVGGLTTRPRVTSTTATSAVARAMKAVRCSGRVMAFLRSRPSPDGLRAVYEVRANSRPVDGAVPDRPPAARPSAARPPAALDLRPLDLRPLGHRRGHHRRPQEQHDQGDEQHRAPQIPTVIAWNAHVSCPAPTRGVGVAEEPDHRADVRHQVRADPPAADPQHDEERQQPQDVLRSTRPCCTPCTRPGAPRRTAPRVWCPRRSASTTVTTSTATIPSAVADRRHRAHRLLDRPVEVRRPRQQPVVPDGQGRRRRSAARPGT